MTGDGEEEELVRYLLDTGADRDEVERARRSGTATYVALDRLLATGEVSLAELSEATGMDAALVVEIYRLLGLSAPTDGRAYFDASETRLFDVVRAAADLPEGMGNEILRAIDNGLAMVAETAVSAFVGSVETDEVERSPRERAAAALAMGDLGLTLGAALGPLFRHHLEAAVRRHRAATEPGAHEVVLAVGFVDLVGFTPTSAAMGRGELIEFIRAFHAQTHEVVSRRGGRLVKHIGDEIMFVTPSADDGCAIAAALVDGFGDGATAARGGVCFGPVVTRHGDYYGTTVNLAARLADNAVPGEVLAPATIAAAAGRTTCAPAGRRLLKGFDDPLEVVSVTT